MSKFISTYITAALLFISIAGLAQTPDTITKEGDYTVTGSETLTASQTIILKPNTWIKPGSSFSATIVQDAYTAPTLTQTENYIYTRTYQRGMTSANGIQYNSDVIEGITYFDGLGRPKQQIGIKASPDKQDMVNHIIYDTHGRQDKQYLPFAQQSGAVGSYQTVDVVADINSYYQNKYSDDFTGMAVGDVNAYSQSIYEPSPLNRVLEQGAPGKAWKADPTTDTDHTIKFDWGTNEANEVVRFSVIYANGNTENPTLTQHNSYSANELHRTLTKDENWKETDGNNRTTKEYKNKLGQVVLKRTYNEGIGHDTYYVYDDFGNLTFVIPPKVDITDNVSATELSELCYQYKYDKRNRLVEKKIPGKGWEYIIYNKIDQPVLTQDANQRANNEWLFTKYDAFGRVTYTGLHKASNTLTRIAMQNSVYTATSQYESRSNPASNLAQTTVHYTNNAAPTSISKVYTINYYDDYSFDNSATNPGSVYNQTIDTDVKGLATGSKIRVLGTDDWITTVTYYDTKARPVYIHSNNQYLNTTDVVESKLDFAGKVLETKTTHSKGSNTPIVTVDTFTYDHTGRVLTQSQKINNQGTEQIVSNTYDEMGQLDAKQVGGGLQDIDYTYNVRGWLQSINDVANLGNDLFAFGINYNTPQNGATALYNGNISETLWRTANDNTQRHYTYDYDGLNRITAATSNDNRYNLSNLTYDSMGNILTLTRDGHLNEAATNFGVMDNLTYTYYNGGNQLKRVSETVAQAVGFTKNSTTGTDYTYDANGNMITDNNKGITGIIYNHLNLPEQTTVNNSTTSGNISYIYDATGAKLKKIATEGSSVTTTEYTNGYIYKDGELEFFSHAEGYVEPNTNSGYDYVYQYKDHLGNIRLSYADKDSDGKIDILRNNADVDGDNDYAHEIMQEKNYYPFGMQWKGVNHTIRGVKNNLKTYQGQELTEDLGLNTHEWRYRISDPSIGRFWQIDPLAEDYTYNSTYAFQENKLGMGIELEGAELLGHDIALYLNLKYQQWDSKVSSHQSALHEAIGNRVEAHKTGRERSNDEIPISTFNLDADKVRDAVTITNSVNEIASETVNTTKEIARDAADGLETTGDYITYFGVATGQPEIIATGEVISGIGTGINVTIDLIEGEKSYGQIVLENGSQVVFGKLSDKALKALKKNGAGGRIVESIIKAHEITYSEITDYIINRLQENNTTVIEGVQTQN